MSDIFISYSSEDRDRILPLVQALEKLGWSVFWDRHILAGKTWRNVIGSEIQDSRSVVVIWTEKSITSEWVQEEAEAGKRKQILIPVLLDNVEPPFGFGNIQAANLTAWNGDNSSPIFIHLVADITTMLGRAPTAVKEVGEHRSLEAEVQRKAEEQERLREQELVKLEAKPEAVRQGRFEEERNRAPVLVEEVHLGAAAPRAVCPGEEFVAYFAAYTAAHRSKVWQVIAEEAPSAQPRLDLETCRWHPGAKVTVRLDAHYVELSNPIQTFEWNGAWCVLRFDAKVPGDIEVNTIILRFDIAVEGLPIVAIRPEIAVSRKEKENETVRSVPVIEQSAPRSAFASYAKKDRRDVLGRVRSLQIFTGIDVFLDCLSMRPSEDWKSNLKNEIHKRDVFWLFWSRSAMASEWVEWEWRTALAEKSLAKIQPHPLEPSELAPPPKELSSLQFGAMYEWYVSQLRESPITRVFRPLLHKATSFYEVYRRWCFAVAVAIIIGAFVWYMYSFAF